MIRMHVTNKAAQLSNQLNAVPSAGIASIAIENRLNMIVMSIITPPWGRGWLASIAASKKIGVQLRDV